MGYSTYILRNLLGRPVRTALTALGLSVAVASVMLLTGISWGFERSMHVIYQSRGIDLIIVRAGISDQLSSNLDEGMADTLRAIPGVAQLSPSLMDVVSFEDANLASVLVAKGEYTRAEGLYREAIAVFERALSPEHLSTGIARIKLGRALLRQGRFAEAERETLAGHEVVRAQASPSVSWLRSARADLVAIYEALGEPERAAPYRDSDAEQR